MSMPELHDFNTFNSMVVLDLENTQKCQTSMLPFEKTLLPNNEKNHFEWFIGWLKFIIHFISITLHTIFIHNE